MYARLPWANRKFLVRVVRYLARKEIDQFVDLGSGILTSPNVHEVARSVIHGAHVAYVDNDAVSAIREVYKRATVPAVFRARKEIGCDELGRRPSPGLKAPCGRRLTSGRAPLGDCLGWSVPAPSAAGSRPLSTPNPVYRIRLPVPARVVVLVSGSGTLVQSLLDAAADRDYPATVVAIGSDRDGIEGLQRARRHGVPAFTVAPASFPDRARWDRALADAVEAHRPDLIVSAGFGRLLGPEFLARFPSRIINTHPALLPAFPGPHPVRDTLAYGVKVTGATVHLVDAGVDSGPVLAQRTVAVRSGDTEAVLHERIKTVERRLLVDTVAALACHGATVGGREVSIP